MITSQELIKIKEIIQEFFQKIGVDAETQVNFPEEQTVSVDIKTEEPKILIGDKGETLMLIERLLRIIAQRKVDKRFYLDLDVNNYKKKKIDYLKQLARSIADDVALNKKEEVLPPMLPYERRIIHLELADRENIATESVDRGPKRRIIIKPYP